MPALDQHVCRHNDTAVAGQQHSSVVARSDSDRVRLAPIPGQTFDHAEFANVAQRGMVVAAHITSGRFVSADFASVSANRRG